MHHEGEATATAVVLDVESYVMIGMCLATTPDLTVDLLDFAIITTRLSPNLPR
jgi:hypothetical protein